MWQRPEKLTFESEHTYIYRYRYIKPRKKGRREKRKFKDSERQTSVANDSLQYIKQAWQYFGLIQALKTDRLTVPSDQQQESSLKRKKR